MKGERGLIKRFLEEDIGPGDVTSDSLLQNERAMGTIRAEQNCIVAGTEEAAEVFRLLGCNVRPLVHDGAAVKKGTGVLEIRGLARRILAGERVALNLLMRMSGIATATAEMVRKAKRSNPKVEIAATRKTAPGLRLLDKKAVVAAGGIPHRLGLFDGVLIKDNHLALVPLEEGIRKAKTTMLRVEVEVKTLAQAIRAARAGANILLLDNMTPNGARRISTEVRRMFPKIKIEISGGVGPWNVARYARYADVVSSGYITHSAKAASFTMDVEKA